MFVIQYQFYPIFETLVKTLKGVFGMQNVTF